MSHHVGGFFTHWEFAFGHWLSGILFWIVVIVLAVTTIQIITKNN